MTDVKKEPRPDPSRSIRDGFKFAKNIAKLKRFRPLHLGSSARCAVADPDDAEAYPDDLSGGLACILSPREAVVDAECDLAGKMFEHVSDAAGFPVGPSYSSPDGTGTRSGNRHFVCLTTGDTANSVPFTVHVPPGREDLCPKPLAIEVLGQNHQVTLPPSRHRNGDDASKWGRYEWLDGSEAPRVPYAGSEKKIGLLDVARWAAAGVQIGLSLPRGSHEGQNRHAISLATAGVLARAGVPRAVAETIIVLAAETVGDSKAETRASDVNSTYEKREAGQTALAAGKALRLALADGGLATLDANRSVDALERLLTNKGSKEPQAGTVDDESAASLLVRQTQEMCELWQDSAGRAYVTLKGDSNTHWRTSSSLFLGWLRKRYWTSTDEIVGSETLNNAVGMINALCGDCEQHEVYVRTAWLNDIVYLDLGGKEGNVVEVSKAGWRVLDVAPPVRFIRPRGMKPLPLPVGGGSLDTLRTIINCTIDGLVLLVAWMLAALSGRSPFPILVFRGPKGSAKTSATEIVKGIIDPAVPMHRGPLDSVRDLFIAASNCAILALDNISDLSPEMSDALCRLSSGGAFGTRSLFTNDEEQIFELARAVVLNGITDFADRPDLLDRVVVIDLEPITEEDRRTEAELLAQVEALRPRILGALLDRLVIALQKLPTTKLTKKPRMADFATLVVASEGDSKRFLELYSANRSDEDATALNACPYAEALFRLVDEGQGRWSGTATALCERLRGIVTPTTALTFPKNGQALVADLTRMKATFAQFEIGIVYSRDGTRMNQKLITITKATTCPGTPNSRSDSVVGINSTSERDEPFHHLPLEQDRSCPSDASDASDASEVEEAVSNKPAVERGLETASDASDDLFQTRGERNKRGCTENAPPAGIDHRPHTQCLETASDASDASDDALPTTASSSIGPRQAAINLDIDSDDADEPVILEPVIAEEDYSASSLATNALQWLRGVGSPSTPEEFADECLITLRDAQAAFETLLVQGLAGKDGQSYFALPIPEGNR